MTNATEGFCQFSFAEIPLEYVICLAPIYIRL